MEMGKLPKNQPQLASLSVFIARLLKLYFHLRMKLAAPLKLSINSNIFIVAFGFGVCGN